MSAVELLQQIVTNKTPVQKSMISITSTKPDFSVNFPSLVPVSEIALAKLRIYHSWPNIRSEVFGGQQPIIHWYLRGKIKMTAPQTGKLFIYQRGHTKLNKSIKNFSEG